MTSEPLAPPPGASAAPVEPAPPTVAAAPSPAIAPEPPPPAAAPVVATGRSSVVGSWNGFDGRWHPMRHRGPSGVWELFIPGVGPGALYKFEI
ncbi:MAG: hypothetical protein NTY84_02380, partial [Verrucomicrobia bacterium]|nr:hypothetical protein [Verrucomicrobiota bacterium]